MYYSKINISVHGSSAHGSTPHLGKDAIVAASSFSTPHLGKDAIVAASSFILNAQALVSRLNNPLKPLVFTVSGVNGGTQFNIITDLVKMTAYLYAGDEENIKAAQPGLTAIAQSTAAAFGCTAELEFGQVQKNGGEA